MNKKSFFWPILSDEERAKAEKAKSSSKGAQEVPVEETFPNSSIMEENMASQTEEPRDEQTSSGFVDLTADVPVLPSSSAPTGRRFFGADNSADNSRFDEAQSPVNRVGSSSSQDWNGTEGADQDDDRLLILENIDRSYEQADEDLVVLRGANLTVRAGEMVALVAPSGAGKSTLLHIAGLLERPTAGEVYIANVAQSQAADRTRTLVRRNEIGFVYQFHHLLAEFTALENVMLPQLIRGETRKEAHIRALELLAYMKIDHRAEHRPAELSGGEKQRVAIARAMANAPRVLLADEPTGNLDPNTSEYVFKALNSLVKQSGIAALVATHNLFLAERMDRQITLVDGKIVDL